MIIYECSPIFEDFSTRLNSEERQTQLENAISLLSESIDMDVEISERFGINEGVGDFFKGVLEKIKEALKVIKEFFKNMADAIKEKFGKAKKEANMKAVDSKLEKAEKNMEEQEKNQKSVQLKVGDTIKVTPEMREKIFKADIEKRILSQSKEDQDIYTIDKNYVQGSENEWQKRFHDINEYTRKQKSIDDTYKDTTAISQPTLTDRSKLYVPLLSFDNLHFKDVDQKKIDKLFDQVYDAADVLNKYCTRMSEFIRGYEISIDLFADEDELDKEYVNAMIHMFKGIITGLNKDKATASSALSDLNHCISNLNNLCSSYSIACNADHMKVKEIN